MKKIITLALAMGLFIGCKKSTEPVVPKEPEILNTKWASLDNDITTKTKVKTYVMLHFKAETVFDMYFSVDKSTNIIPANTLTESYKYLYPKFYVLERDGTPTVNPNIIGTFVNDSTLNFFNLVFYKVK